MPLPPFNQLMDEFNSHTIRFTMCPTLWQDTNIINNYFSDKDFNFFKFFNDDISDINNDINIVPNDKGGIYFFVFKSDVLPDLSSHIMYIGRAYYTESQNLRKRCKEYFIRYFKNYEERPQIYIMLNKWSKNLYLYFVELTNNEDIEDIEKKLINNILPPFNHNIPSAEIRRIKNATKAF